MHLLCLQCICFWRWLQAFTQLLHNTKESVNQAQTATLCILILIQYLSKSIIAVMSTDISDHQYGRCKCEQTRVRLRSVVMAIHLVLDHLHARYLQLSGIEVD